jgi:hypothetical protein
VGIARTELLTYDSAQIIRTNNVWIDARWCVHCRQTAALLDSSNPAWPAMGAPLAVSPE